MIKLLRPIDISPGDLVYCGLTGKKRWRIVWLKDSVSAHRYNICFSGWNISAGSECKYLVKKKRKLPL